MVSCFQFPTVYMLMLSYYLFTVYGATVRSSVQQQYQNQAIHCTANEPCNIFCQHENACHNTHIYCAQDASCTVLCQQDTACANAIIHAEQASSFELLDCATGSFTCRGLTIYFPPNNNGIARASIIGADTGLSAGSTLAEPLQFYAIYGWKDVNISTASTFTYQYHAGVMHCTEDLDISCDFNADEWQCADAEDTCNDPLLYNMEATIIMMQTDIETQFAVHASMQSHLLYVLIGALLFFLCFFGFILFYYMHYSTQVPSEADAKTQPSSTNWSVKFSKFPSFSRAGSSITSPNSVPSLDSSPPNSKVTTLGMNDKKTSAETEGLRKQSDDTTSAHSTTHSTDDTVVNINTSWQYNAASNHPVSVPHINIEQLEPPQPQYPSRITPQYRVSTSVPSLPSDNGHNIHNIHNMHNIHYLIPSVSYQASCESSCNEAPHIVYQPPSQQQMMQMFTMMNHSNPPSLSSFVKNNENGDYVMNQQPIEPSAQSSDDSLCVPQRRTTMTSDTTHDQHMKVPPASSVLSAFTNVTVSDAAISENSADNRSNASCSDLNLNLKVTDAVYVD